MDHLAVFARWPEPGRVKTRLSPALPAALACDLYRALLDDALAAAARAGAGARYLYWADAPAGRGDFAAPSGFETRDQGGGDLGARLERAFGRHLERSGDRAVVIGADCPDLDVGLIERAFETLARADLVLGPARDGGYYLIGLARPAPALFRGMRWGTAGVLEETRARAHTAGLRTALLEPLDDLDTPADLVRWLGRAACGRAAAAPATTRALRAIGLLAAGGPESLPAPGPVSRSGALTES